MKKLRVGDKVVILAGKAKTSNTGGYAKNASTISSINWKKKTVIVEGKNLVSKAFRANEGAGESGGIRKIEAPIHISNIALLSTKMDKPSRVGIKTEGDKKVRYLKKCNTTLNGVNA